MGWPVLPLDETLSGNGVWILGEGVSVHPTALAMCHGLGGIQKPGLHFSRLCSPDAQDQGGFRVWGGLMFPVHRRRLQAVSSYEGRGREALASSKDTQPTDKGSVPRTSAPFS